MNSKQLATKTNNMVVRNLRLRLRNLRREVYACRSASERLGVVAMIRETKSALQARGVIPGLLGDFR
jgi:hypothetical protein